MAQQNAKDRLVGYLDDKAFRPVLQADPQDYPESKRGRLAHVQRATRDERDRYRDYPSAQKVFEMYRSDLSSEAAKDVNRELRALDLPTLHDVRDGFEKLADDLGVKH